MIQPKGWFYIVSPSQHDHVLTVINMSYEVKYIHIKQFKAIFIVFKKQ